MFALHEGQVCEDYFQTCPSSGCQTSSRTGVHPPGLLESCGNGSVGVACLVFVF